MKYNCISTRIRKLIWEKRASDEKKRKNHYDSDTYTFVIYILLLIPLALTMALKAQDVVTDDVCIFKEAGVFFTCKRCRTSQWQDPKNQDWWGDYHCAVCGVRMGDE